VPCTASGDKVMKEIKQSTSTRFAKRITVWSMARCDFRESPALFAVKSFTQSA
jgi:hypothetical protein